MKRILLLAALMAALFGCATAAHGQALVDCALATPCTTSGPVNTGTGDPSYLAFGKVNADFQYVWSVLAESGATPGGTTGQIQYNNSGAFGGLPTTGTGNAVLATNPTLVAPALGTPSALTLTNATGLSLTTGVTGTLSVSSGGNGLTTATLGDLRYGSAANALSILAGNTTTTRQFLAQTGTGSASAAPLWTALASGDLPAINLTATGAGGVIPSGASGNCYISGGTSSAPSWGTCGSGSGTVNPATQYYFPYYSAAGSASTLSGVGCSSTGFFEGSNSAAPTCVAPGSFPNLTAYTTPASGDLLLIGSAANSYATDQITLAGLFGSVPAPLSLNPGATSAPAWTTNGLVFTGTAATLTDTSSSGTIAQEAFAALPAYTLAASSAMTATDLTELYLPVPIAGTNVTATNKLSLYAAGSIYVTGTITAQSNIVSDGQVTIASSGDSHSAWLTTGYNFVSTPGALTDTSSTGTVTTEAALGISAMTLKASNAITVTNEDQLYIAAPIASTNVTATNLWSLHTAGGILDAGQLYDTALTTGTNADFLCLSSAGQFLLQASSCTISSRRFKRDIELLKDASAVMKLEPVFFQMKPTVPNHDRNYYHPQVGLTAENVAVVLPKCAVYEQDMKTPKSYRPECVMAYGVKLLQKHQLLLQDYERTFEQQQWEIGLLALWCALLTLPRALKLARARA